MTGRKSSLPAAKRVFWMAVASTWAGSSAELASSKSGSCGNSAPSTKATEYLPKSLLISTAWVLSSNVKVSGCSGKDFRVSNKIRAGTAAKPLPSASTRTVVLMVVSRSDAVIFRADGANSNKMLSKIGNVLLLLITPEMDCKERSNWLLETMNFIGAN